MLLHRYCFLIFLTGFSSRSQAQTLRSKKGKSIGGSGKGGSVGSSSKGGSVGKPSKGEGVVIVGDSSGGGGPPPGSSDSMECGTTPPPSLTGGCDLACDFFKLAEKGAQAVIGTIPEVGSFFSILLGVFWPSGTNDAEEILNATITYIDGILAQYETTNVLDSIKDIYEDLMDDVNSLDARIQDGDSPQKRWDDLEAIFRQCNDFNNYIANNALPPIEPLQNLTVDPIAVLAAIGNIGQVCLAMRTVEVYHYNSTIGGNQSAGDLTTAKANLDAWVQNYTDFAQISTTNALTWRMNQIKSASSDCSGGNDDGGDTCVTGSFEVESLMDMACFSVGGPPPSTAFVIGDSNSECACDSSFSEFVTYYQSIVTQSFTDNFLPISRSLVPLWRYQTSENMDAEIKPSPVIRVATSLIDAYVKVDFRQDYYAYTFPAAEMAEIYTVYNGPVSQGQRTDRITQVDVWMSAGSNVPLEGAIVSQVVGGQSATLQIGKSVPTDDDDGNQHVAYSLVLEDNERIVAVGATDCGDPNFASDAGCLSLGFAFKTAYVNASGAFESEGRLWNPLNYPVDANWTVAPPLAQSRNATFLPHVIAFNGWATADSNDDTTVGAKVPVWLYESLE